MRILFRIIPLCMLLLGFVACDDEDEAKVETLEVTPANLNGTWQLVEWNGESLAEGTYCYITFVRRDKTFQMYQKFDSMYARFFSGTFEIEKDDDLDKLYAKLKAVEVSEYKVIRMHQGTKSSRILVWKF